MSRDTALMTMVVAGLVSGIVAADAHDSWISRGGYRNPAGEWCCGATDCEAHEEIATTGAGPPLRVRSAPELVTDAPPELSHRPG